MVIVTANTEQMWQKLCAALDHEEWIEDPRFGTGADRLANREQLGELLEGCFRTQSSDEWLRRLTALEIPVAPINTLDKALADPHVLSRQIVWTLTNASGISFEAPGNPIRVVGDESVDARWPPRLGEHSDSILRELLQLDDEAIADLVKNGVVVAGPTNVHA
jgi:crotonobetainyl-CoA:carnitine CoA-transferase CaiB-like acyl-CoA transferase